MTYENVRRSDHLLPCPFAWMSCNVCDLPVVWSSFRHENQWKSNLYLDICIAFTRHNLHAGSNYAPDRRWRGRPALINLLCGEVLDLSHHWGTQGRFHLLPVLAQCPLGSLVQIVVRQQAEVT